jgi:hypothetical protein
VHANDGRRPTRRLLRGGRKGGAFVLGAYVAKPNVKTFSGGEFGWGGTSVKG